MRPPGSHDGVPFRTLLFQYTLAILVGAVSGYAIYLLAQRGPAGLPAAVILGSVGAALGAGGVVVLLLRRAYAGQLEDAAFLRLVVGGSSVGLWVLDEELRTSWINDEMCAILGEAPDPAHRWEEYFGEALEAAAGTEVPAGVPDRENRRVLVVRPDGTRRDVLMHVDLLGGAGAGFLGLLAIAIDLTQQREEEDRAEQTALSETVQATVARLNHKINNSLMVIRGQTEVHLRRNPEDDNADGFKRIIGQVDQISMELKALREATDVETESYLGSRTILRVGTDGPGEVPG